MDELLLLFLIIVISCFIIKYMKQQKEQHKEQITKEIQNESQNYNQTTNSNWKDNYTFDYNYSYMPYAKAHLLTKTEHAFFVTLVREALKRRLLVCPKVRLEDIIFVTDKKYRDKYRGYIKSRHVDFVLIDKTGDTIAAVELDDPSHEQNEAKKIDRFKNELFQKVKIPLIRIKTGTDYITQLNVAFDSLNISIATTNPEKKQNS